VPADFPGVREVPERFRKLPEGLRNGPERLGKRLEELRKGPAGFPRLPESFWTLPASFRKPPERQWGFSVLPVGEGRLDYAARLQRQRCKVCWNADGFNFHIPDEIWVAVVPPDLRTHVVCLRCFDDFAAGKGINYQDHLAAELHFAGDQAALVMRIIRRS